jgi:hypothetical protein
MGAKSAAIRERSILALMREKTIAEGAKKTGVNEKKHAGVLCRPTITPFLNSLKQRVGQHLVDIRPWWIRFAAAIAPLRSIACVQPDRSG